MVARHLLAPVLALFLVALCGCDASLDPYTAENRHFSIFGYLDVTEDVHWVRIEALKDSVAVGAAPDIDATATLIHLPSGRKIVFKDSLFRYNRGLAHNFYAEVDLQLGDAYRFVVRDSSGNTSTVETTMPRSIPELSLDSLGRYATIEGGTKDRFLYVAVAYHVFVDIIDAPPEANFSTTYTVQYAHRVSRTETGYRVRFTWESDLDSVYTGRDAVVTLIGVGVDIGLVHPDAPLYGRISYEELLTPGAPPSNVENGFGYLPGIATDEASVTIPPDRRPQIIVPP